MTWWWYGRFGNAYTVVCLSWIYTYIEEICNWAKSFSSVLRIWGIIRIYRFDWATGYSIGQLQENALLLYSGANN